MTASPERDALSPRLRPAIAPEDLPLQRVHARVKQRPDSIFMTQPIGGGAVDDISWGRTLDEAKRAATHLRSLALPAGSRIGILSGNCAHFLIADLAIWMAGHVSVALYSTANAKTIGYVLSHAEVKLLFLGHLGSWPEQRAGIPAGLPLVTFPRAPQDAGGISWPDLLAKNAPIAGDPVRDADDLAVIMYTSGSTGTPKGAMHSFRTMATAAHNIGQRYGMDENDRGLSYLPLAHAIERACLETLAFLYGGRVFFVWALETFREDLVRARPTIFVSVPRLWLKFQQGVLQKLPEKKLNRLLKIPILSRFVKKKILRGLGLDAVRYAASGSAPIPPALHAWWRAVGLELLEGYAMTENFCYSHGTHPGDSRIGYVGTTLAGVECRLSPEGEILVKSPCDMLGYYREPELTRESFTEDGFLKTGDRGEVDAQGRLRLTGRVKELFKTGKGKYVAPAPIENLLNADTRVESTCVAGVGREQPHALVLLNEDAARAVSTDPAFRAALLADFAALIERVNAQVESHEQLSFLAIVSERWTPENGYLTPTLKLRRSVIEAAYAPRLDAWYANGARVISA